MKPLKSVLKKTTYLVAVVAACWLLTGCAQVMAIKEPSPYKPTCFVVGTKRATVIGDLGKPLSSEKNGKDLTDVYKYTDGGEKNSGLSKTTRIIVYTGGDLFTLWLDQIIWIPMEKFGFAGTDHAVTVNYTNTDNGSWRITKVDNRVLKGRSHKTESF